MAATENLPRALGAGGIARGALAWHLYLFLGFFQFIINIQGNVLPFLRTELDLSYRALGFHPSAIAVGAILVGLFGDIFIRRYGRRLSLVVGVLGVAGAVALLCLANSAAVSLSACLLLGLLSGFIPTVIFASLAERYGEKRSIAFNEATAIASGFGILAPLLTGVCIALGLGWRSAALVGAFFGLAVLASFRRHALPEPALDVARSTARLPAVYWAYWAALAFGIATEFCILLWAPAFLETVVGLTVASAAAAAAAFAVAVFLGRVLGSGLVRFIAVPRLYLAAFALAIGGFAVYWGVSNPVIALAGLFVLGLGVSLLYPLTFGMAMGVAGPQGDKASVRVAIAAGVALFTMPAALGELADWFGLHNAHLIVPTLLVAGLVAFAIGRRLERTRLTRDASMPPGGQFPSSA